MNHESLIESLDEIKRINSVLNDLAHETMDLSAKLSAAREVIGVLTLALDNIVWLDANELGEAAWLANKALESTCEKRERVMG